jgi:hypothetical protein
MLRKGKRRTEDVCLPNGPLCADQDSQMLLICASWKFLVVQVMLSLLVTGKETSSQKGFYKITYQTGLFKGFSTMSC